jgi:hypothetical protein
MRSLFIAVALTAAISQATSSQTSQSYAGTWIADFTGTTYVRLELEGPAAMLNGRIALGNIEVDKQGEVIKAAPAPQQLTPIFDVAPRTTNIAFSRKDGRDTDHFEMRLLGNDTAELLFIPSEADRKELAAIGVPAPKPIRLKKVSR